MNKNLLFILIISFFGIASTFPSSRCKTKNGIFPKEGSFCRSYYKCQNWQKLTEVRCPRNKNFHPAKEYCVAEEEYPCFEKPPTSLECPKPNGKFLKKGTGCREFYDCCDGNPIEKICPEDFLFDPKRGICEYPERYTCIEEPVLTKCPQPNGKFVKESTNCKTYYDCRNSVPTERNCPEDQLFDAKRKTCDWNELVTCDNDSNFPKCQKPNGKFLKKGTKCKVFYDCRNNIPTERNCPAEQLFDRSRGSCEWEELVTCDENDDGFTTATPRTSEEPTEVSTKQTESTAETTEQPTEVSTKRITASTAETTYKPIEVTTKRITDATAGTTDQPTEIFTKKITGATAESTQGTTEVSTAEIIATTEENTEQPTEVSTDRITATGVETTEVYTTPFTHDFTTKLTTLISTTKTSTITIDSSEEDSKESSGKDTSSTTFKDQQTTVTFESSTYPITTPSTGSSEEENNESSEENTLSTSSEVQPTTESLESSRNPDSTTDKESSKFPEGDQSSTTIAEITPTTSNPYTSKSSTLDGGNSEESSISTESDLSSSISYDRTSDILVETSTPFEFTIDEITTEENSKTTENDLSSTITYDSTTDDEELVTTSTNDEELVKTSIDTQEPTDYDYDNSGESSPVVLTSSRITRQETDATTGKFTPATTKDPVVANFICPKPNGWYPHPTYRRKFIGCVGGDPRLMDCPSNLVYVHEKRMCDYDTK